MNKTINILSFMLNYVIKIDPSFNVVRLKVVRMFRFEYTKPFFLQCYGIIKLHFLTLNLRAGNSLISLSDELYFMELA
jgi:hypothetical protein